MKQLIEFADSLMNYPIQWFRKDVELVYVTESPSWIIEKIGEQVLGHLKSQELMNGVMRNRARGFSGKVLHFGSINAFRYSSVFKKKNKNGNKIVATWFHVDPNDAKTELIPEMTKLIDVYHTASTKTCEVLESYGVPKDKIVKIPLGVELDVFSAPSAEEKAAVRKELGIPEGVKVIGSFQKDGEGWGEGMKPKWVKGPDVFCDVVERVAKEVDVFVLLTGPARGYVKERLDKAGIAYRHDFLNSYSEVARYYQALDLYVVGSRVEGGPEAFVETMATGVPLVTTEVGMASDILRHGENAMVCGVDDVDLLTACALEVLKDEEKAAALAEAGLEEVIQYGWDVLSKRYFEDLYRPLQ